MADRYIVHWSYQGLVWITDYLMITYVAIMSVIIIINIQQTGIFQQVILHF